MIARKFMFRGEELPDIDESMSPEQIKEVYSHDYPELVNAAIVYHDPKDNVQEYSFAEASAPAKVTETPAGKPGSKPAKAQTVEFKPSIGRKG